jgi:hypothetical protein
MLPILLHYPSVYSRKQSTDTVHNISFLLHICLWHGLTIINTKFHIESVRHIEIYFGSFKRSSLNSFFQGIPVVWKFLVDPVHLSPCLCPSPSQYYWELLLHWPCPPCFYLLLHLFWHGFTGGISYSHSATTCPIVDSAQEIRILLWLSLISQHGIH